MKVVDSFLYLHIVAFISLAFCGPFSWNRASPFGEFLDT